MTGAAARVVRCAGSLCESARQHQHRLGGTHVAELCAAFADSVCSCPQAVRSSHSRTACCTCCLLVWTAGLGAFPGRHVSVEVWLHGSLPVFAWSYAGPGTKAGQQRRQQQPARGAATTAAAWAMAAFSTLGQMSLIQRRSSMPSSGKGWAGHVPQRFCGMCEHGGFSSGSRTVKSLCAHTIFAAGCLKGSSAIRFSNGTQQFRCAQ